MLRSTASGLFLLCILGPPGTASAQPGSHSTGLVQARLRVMLHSPVEGVLADLNVEEGQSVEAGQPIARMRDTIQAARVAAAKAAADSNADISAARVKVEEATDRLARTQEASASGAVTEWEVREARATLATGQAELQAARERRTRDRARLQVERAILEEYQLRAPFDGTIVSIFFDEGATLSKRDALIEIVALGELEAILHVPSSWRDQIRVGMDASLYPLDSVPGPITARVRSIDPVLDPASQTVRVVFTVANEDRGLPAGFNVELRREDLGSLPQVGAGQPKALRPR